MQSKSWTDQHGAHGMFCKEKQADELEEIGSAARADHIVLGNESSPMLFHSYN